MDYGACYGRGGAGSFPPARLLSVILMCWTGWVGWAGWVVGNTLFVLYSTRAIYYFLALDATEDSS